MNLVLLMLMNLLKFIASKGNILTQVFTVQFIMKKILVFIIFLGSYSFGQNNLINVHYIGEKIGGGIVFYIDGSGKHGLIAAENDQALKVSWGKNGIIGANSLTDGMSNTNKIVKFLSNSRKCAACNCKNLKDGGYNDWYLPSLNELIIMHEKQEIIGNFLLGEYCSSTEVSGSQIWNVHFRPHRRIEFHYHKTKAYYNIRCIRKF